MIVCISERSLYYEFQDLNSGSVELVNKEQFNTKELARDEATHRFAQNSAIQSVELLNKPKPPRKNSLMGEGKFLK